MLFQIGDKFLVGDTEVEVRFINAGMAWVYNLEEPDHGCQSQYEILDAKGRDRQGRKVKTISNLSCGAV